MSDGPPPLIDSSSDEEELERWQRRRVPPVIDSGRDCDSSNHQQEMPPLVNNNEDDVVEHVEEVLAEDTSEAPEPPQRYPPSPDLNLRSNRQEAEQEAFEFCLARMKQTQNGLQAFDHEDFARVLNQAALFTPSLKPLVVMQEAQVDAFTSGEHEMSPISGWMWRGRKGSGVVKGVKGLGMLQHLRDGRLIPYRLGCNCLYDHPALKHLLSGRENGSSPDAFPRLMHINPSMSGPVILRRREKGVVPGAVAFAGAEFVVVGKTVVGVEEVWEVVSELSEFFASQFAEDLDESPPPSPPGLEGVPESHTKHGTARSTLFVPATSEGMLTLLEGQAPGDMDRFKAWHMDPEFHTISHHVWCSEDLRIFLFLHRLLFVFWVVPFTVQQLSGLLRIVVLCGYLVMLACRLSAHEDWLYEYYRSRVGQAVVAVMRMLLVVWCVVRKVLKVASMLARELVTQMMTLPGLIVGEKGVVIMMAIVLVTVELTHLVAGIVYTLYRAGVDLTIACLPRVPWLASSVRFADAALGYLLNLVFVLFLGSVSLVLWWYSPPKEAPSVQTEKRYRELLEKTDPESKEELAKLVKELISNLRHKNEVAVDRRRNIKTKGARDCFGGRRVCAHACSGALAVAAIKLKRKASSQEMAHIKLILAKSGIIRDSLVRTARVMLATDPTKAVAEVSHELFHAAYDGLIWPDEPLIGKALQSEGRDPTAENVNWHRAKWVAVAAELIVDQEHTSWFKVPTGSTIEGGDTLRDSDVHPAERCVHCYTRQEGSDSSAAAAARHRCMKTEGRKPSARFSSCRSAVVKQSKRHKVLPRFELAEEKCCVIPADSESFTGMAAGYPYFHVEARRPGVDGPERSRRLAVRVRSLDEKFDWLVSLDKEMDEAKAAAQRPASGPQDGQPNAKDQEEDDKTMQERKAAQERKARRVKARKERAKEAEAVRLQRLKELEELIAAEEKEVDDGSAEGDSATEAAEEEEEEDEASLCIVCMTEKRNACLVHGKTAHLVVCLLCGKRLKKANMGCPICKRKIDVVIESFTS